MSLWWTWSRPAAAHRRNRIEERGTSGNQRVDTLGQRALDGRGVHEVAVYVPLPLHHLRGQRLHVAEVPVHRADGNTGALRDLRRGRRQLALFVERDERFHERRAILGSPAHPTVDGPCFHDTIQH